MKLSRAISRETSFFSIFCNIFFNICIPIIKKDSFLLYIWNINIIIKFKFNWILAEMVIIKFFSEEHYISEETRCMYKNETAPFQSQKLLWQKNRKRTSAAEVRGLNAILFLQARLGDSITTDVAKLYSHDSKDASDEFYKKRGNQRRLVKYRFPASQRDIYKKYLNIHFIFIWINKIKAGIQLILTIKFILKNYLHISYM